MSEQTPNVQARIVADMVSVRSRGLLNARDLSQEVDRLGDWREHVRAYPVPLVLATAALGYWAVPARARKSVSQQPTSVDTASSSVSTAGTAAQQTDAKAQRSGGLAGAAMGFVGSLAANAIRSYVSEQMHTLIQGNQNHDAQQRQASHRFTGR